MRSRNHNPSSPRNRMRDRASQVVEVPMTLQEEVEALAQPEGRVVGTLGHEQARQHLVGRLQQIGLSPYRGHTFALPYRAAGRDFCNLIAVVPGRDPALAPVLIGAHYDSVIAAPCADDN